ncbi:MAG: cation-translocating P-type ATPase [Firmicutes bacterium]|nr:cation-translocating P-type ATPase [Bacillota bacterium]
MSQWYNQTGQQVLDTVESNEHGLSTKQATERKAKYGANCFEKKKKESLLLSILHPLKDISEIVLMVAATLSFIMAVRAGNDFSNYISPIVIVVIIVINVTLSVIQQRGAEKAMEALEKLNSPTSMVLRDGLTLKVPTEDLVPGDIVVLKTGDLISADCRILSSEQFIVDEASLTGESEPVNKKSDPLGKEDAPLGDQKNMLFSGTLVAGGHARAVVVSTGMTTQMGKIAKYLNNTKKQKTPLQHRVERLGRGIAVIAILAALAIIVLGLIDKQDPWQLALVAITLSVAAVPETLNVIITLTLMQGIKKMTTKNAMIRKLQAVETLGSVSIICSDKTGTLTQNKMTVKRLWCYGQEVISETEVETEEQKNLVKQLILASNAFVETETQDDGTVVERIIGDPTESALARLAMSLGMDIDKIRDAQKRVIELPFSSSRKMMSVVVQEGDKYRVLTKGAFDRIPYIVHGIEYRHQLAETHDGFAQDALRVITIATKVLDHMPDKEDVEAIESNLDFVGFVGIIDPPRLDVKDAIKVAKEAGVRTVMITGDHAATATAIARELGIITAGEGVITGAQLSKLSDDELFESIENFSVYARVTPEDKIRVVQAWQRSGAVISMTGDGVNDAPALKAADVGISMGIAGTEVAKSASDMILADDKFSTIVSAIREGRNVFGNIKALVYFLVVCNASEIIIMLFGVLMFRQGDVWYLPVTPIMLLIVNILGDGIPGLALSKQVGDARIMKRKPIDRHESFFGGGVSKVIIEQAIMNAIIALVGYYIGARVGVGKLAPTHQLGQTMVYLLLGLSSVLHIFVVKSRKSVFRKGTFQNKQLWVSAGSMFALICILAAIPGLNTVLGMVDMDGAHWGIVFGLAVIPLLFAEYGKFWEYIKEKTAEKNRIKVQKI